MNQVLSTKYGTVSYRQRTMMNTVSKIPIIPLHQEVADRVRELISRGVLNIGERIVESKMCACLGISRTPFREGLKILASEGLVDLVPNKGAYVAQPSTKDVREMLEVMSILEGACARVAVERMEESDFRIIERTHQELEAHYASRNHEEYLAANHEFHLLVQEMAGNKILDDVTNCLRQKIWLFRNRQLYQPDRFAASIREHRDLLEAFRRRDADGAERLMKLHLINQCEAIVRLLESHGGRSGPIE